MTSGWRGNFPLLEAFFGYYIGGRLVAYGLGLLMFANLGFLGWFFGILTWSGYWLWSLVTLWRCSYNTEHAFLFYGARAIVLVDIVYSIANPPLFAFNA